MGMQMYLVQPENNNNDQDRVTIAEFIAYRQGFILMATSYGSLIMAMDDSYLDAVKAHHLVKFVGGVTFNPNGPGVAALQRMFAQNVALQLHTRKMAPPGTTTSVSDTDSFPPGYRPLRWPKRDEKGGR